MSVAPIRTAVVGLGYFGSFHARHHAANPKATLVAVVDADPARRNLVAAEYGAAALAGHRDLIGRVDAVSVTVPTSLHHAVAADLLDAGIHVLVEKPIAATLEEGRDLVARADASGAVLQVGHIERFSPVFRALAERAAAPRHIEAVRIAPWKGRAVDVDVVLDLMIHDIDLVLALAGPDAAVTTVEATGAAVRGATNDWARAEVGFSTGLVAVIEASRIAPLSERRMTVATAGGTFIADFAARRLSDAAGAATEFAASDNLAAEIDGFLDAAAGRGPVPVDGRAGNAALDLAERIRHAIQNSPARSSAGLVS
nr:Gfo/Idh/MocA family oxidoreductase [Prosthecomicrobium pneumaticum]